MTRNHDYTITRLIRLFDLSKHYKLTVIDFFREVSTNSPRRINFTRRLEKINGVTMLFIAANEPKRILNFLFRITERIRII